jgi:hypothetical protein
MISAVHGCPALLPRHRVSLYHSHEHSVHGSAADAGQLYCLSCRPCYNRLAQHTQAGLQEQRSTAQSLLLDRQF